MTQTDGHFDEIEIIGDSEQIDLTELSDFIKLKHKSQFLKTNRHSPSYKMSLTDNNAEQTDQNPTLSVPLIPISDREIQMLLGTIPEYHPGGNLSLFVQKVDKLLTYLEGRLTDTLAYIVLDTIQLKIKGEAENYIACLNISTWDEIRAALLRKYGDQRSEEILANELRKITHFKGESYSDFYGKIITAYNSIIEHLQLNISEEALIKFKRMEYTQFAINTFKYGILEPYRSHLKYFSISSLANKDSKNLINRSITGQKLSHNVCLCNPKFLLINSGINFIIIRPHFNNIPNHNL